MFSGIIEAVEKIQAVEAHAGLLRIVVSKPSKFNDLFVGCSIAADGVCLTLERFDESSMQFGIAAETLHITGWNVQGLSAKLLNLERSLCLGARIHGHLVTGHVDALGRVVSRNLEGESLILTIEFPKSLLPMIWKKGSVAVNGVSLTLNSVVDQQLSVCLIPETLKQTNLADLQVGNNVNLEADMWARGLVHYMRTEGRKDWN